ncbi:hypothetical protein C8R43DRAFT_1048963 [Mycena crocata]|nr:hypothetical protein C8R43DRAFT_1048963 [Mycena crocata]
MFPALKLCAPVLLLATFVAAVSIEAPEAPTSAGETTIVWTDADDLPTFSVELAHPDFNNALAIANSVNPDYGKIQVTLPNVPAGEGYTIQFVNIANINDVYATSSPFSIAAPVLTSESATPFPSATGASATAPAPTNSLSPMSGMSGSMSMPMSGSIRPSGSLASSSNARSAASATASSAGTRSHVSVFGFGGPVLAVSTLLGLVAAAATGVL